MEPKTHSVIVGFFVLIALVLLAVFVLWIARFDWRDSAALYDIYFDGSVTGLRQYEDVRYHGVPIGEVRHIGIDKNNPDRVRVRVSIQYPHLIRQDAVASLEAQGLTGFTYVQIQGGGKESPPITAGPHEKFPVIPSVPSRIEMLFSDAPQVVSKVYELANRLSDVLDDPHRHALHRIIDHLDRITGELAVGPNAIPQVMGQLSQTLYNTDQALHRIANAASGTADRIEHVIRDNQGGLNAFIEGGLVDFGLAMGEMKTVLNQLAILMGQLNDGPLNFLRQSHRKGVSIP